MDRKQVTDRLESILDDLAEIEHQRWAHWQNYVHDNSQKQPDGSLIIPSELVRRWNRQIETPYSELSEKEKESDRDQARKYFDLLVQTFS